MKKILIVGGSILALVIVLNVAVNIANKPEIHKNTTTVAKKVIKQGSGWYVNDDFLDKSFRRGSSNPEIGDSIEIGLDDRGWVVHWKVNNQ